MYTVYLYKNTGYNSINIPDSPARLPAATFTIQALDTIQDRFLDNIRVRLSWEQVKNCDYCKVGDFYYFIDSITMQSLDVASLAISADYITSAGGPIALDFLDGITERHHVAQDDFGQYDKDDPLLMPTQPLQLVMGSRLFDPEPEHDNDFTFISTTADLGEMASNNLNSITYTDEITGESVTVPHLKPLQTATTFKLNDDATKDIRIEGQGVFNANNATVQESVQFCRDIAAESAILGQYAISSKYVGIQSNAKPGIFYDIIIGKNTTLTDATIKYNYAEVKNKRVLYGELNKIGLITAKGDQLELAPEWIYNGEDTGIPVVMKTDPRQDGRPYYRFRYYLGSDGWKEEENLFWNNCVAGEQWRNVPLIFSTMAGREQQNANTRKSLILKDFMQEKQRFIDDTNLLTGAIPTMASLGATAAVAPAGAMMDNYSTGMQFASQSSGLLGNLFTANARGAIRDTQYSYDINNTLYAALSKQSIVVPDVKFPISGGSIRDFVGNGVQVYRYRPTDVDLNRMDKLLTMYGYAHIAKLEKSFFTNRQYFNYIKASNISLGGNLPRWWKNAIIKQFNNGIRIWHVAPNESYYDNNPIKEANE